MERVAFFDFCETLVDFQTADAFVHFIRGKSGNQRMKRWNVLASILSKSYILTILEMVVKRPLNKWLVLWQLKGLSQADVQYYAKAYYEEKLKPHQIDTVIERLHLLQESGYRIVLVSGGYDAYLKVFAEHNHINPEDVISSKIQFHEGICTGKMDGMDCMGQNKITLMESSFNRNDIDSISFSDSESDLPMLLWSKDSYVISHKNRQKWAEMNNIKQIIWQ